MPREGAPNNKDTTIIRVFKRRRETAVRHFPQLVSFLLSIEKRRDIKVFGVREAHVNRLIVSDIILHHVLLISLRISGTAIAVSGVHSRRFYFCVERGSVCIKNIFFLFASVFRSFLRC
jgi:hypothetical protein